MIIPISFPQPCWIFMRKFSWMCKQSKSSDNNSQLPFYFIVYLQNSKLQKSFTRKVFEFPDINTGMCCSSVLGVPEIPMYTWSWMALLIWWLLIRSVKQPNPRPGLGMLRKNVWKSCVADASCYAGLYRDLLQLCWVNTAHQTKYMVFFNLQ